MKRFAKYSFLLLSFVFIHASLAIFIYAISQKPIIDYVTGDVTGSYDLGPNIGGMFAVILNLAFIVAVIAPLISISLYSILLRILARLNKFFTTKFLHRLYIVIIGCLLIGLVYVMYGGIASSVTTRRVNEAQAYINENGRKGLLGRYDENSQTYIFESETTEEYQDPYRTVYINDIRLEDFRGIFRTQMVMDLIFVTIYTFINVVLFGLIELIIKLIKYLIKTF